VLVTVTVTVAVTLIVVFAPVVRVFGRARATGRRHPAGAPFSVCAGQEGDTNPQSGMSLKSRSVCLA